MFIPFCVEQGTKAASLEVPAQPGDNSTRDFLFPQQAFTALIASGAGLFSLVTQSVFNFLDSFPEPLFPSSLGIQHICLFSSGSHKGDFRLAST